MLSQRYGTLQGLTVAINVYSSYTEADTAAGKELAMLAQGNDNLAYRGPLADAREIVAAVIEGETGIARKTKPSVDSKGKPVLDKDGNPVLEFDELEGAYAKRVCSLKGWEDLKSLQTQVDEAIAAANEGTGLAVDIKGRERKPSLPKKLARKYKDTACVVIGAGNVDRFLDQVRSTSNPGVAYTPTGDLSETYEFKGEVKGKPVSYTVSAKDAEALGWIIKAHSDWKEAQELAEIGG